MNGGREIWDITGLSEGERPFERSRPRPGVKTQMDYTEVYWILCLRMEAIGLLI